MKVSQHFTGSRFQDAIVKLIPMDNIDKLGLNAG